MIRAIAAFSPNQPLGPHQINRRQPSENDVAIDIQYCGICHSDIHTARNEWRGTVYPCVPGHEIVGKIRQVGAQVKKFKPGDLVGVGCLVDSCRRCRSCQEHLEQHCENNLIFTYNSPDTHLGGVTFGGYSQSIVVDQHFVLRIPPQLNPAASAPLLCAGITTYSPLKRFNVGKGQKVGIIGLGGLGHMGIKFASSFGAHTVAITTSSHKVHAARRLGADDVIVSADQSEMNQHTASFDFILNTVSAKHDINLYLNLVKRSGTMILVGAPEHPLGLMNSSLVMQRRHLAGSLIGGIKETQEMLDYCGKHGITCDIELINADQINEAYQRVLKNDVNYRFVIDIAGSLK